MLLLSNIILYGYTTFCSFSRQWVDWLSPLWPYIKISIAMNIHIQAFCMNVYFYFYCVYTKDWNFKVIKYSKLTFREASKFFSK